jgi:hypothetical protein
MSQLHLLPTLPVDPAATHKPNFIPADPELLAYLLERTTLDEQTGCRVWNMGTSSQGKYATLGHGGTVVYAHRLAYKSAYGAIPEGSIKHESMSVEIHHSCRNRLCIEPTHLVAITRNLHGAAHRGNRRKRPARVVEFATQAAA